MKYFGTDGIRGIPNKNIKIDLLTRIGESISLLNNKDVVIGTDTRISKDMLAYAISAAALSRGLTVHFAGVIPTPALIYYSYVKGYVGVMITASHNPYEDNGIKIINKGYKLSLEEELILENYIDNPVAYTGEVGNFVVEDIKTVYFEYLQKFVNKTNLKITIDCANGASYETAPYLFDKVANDLVVLSDKPNGININYNCGSTHLEYLKQIMKDNNSDLGFAFDGDADRVLCVNSNGETIDGDMIIYLFARYLKSINKLNDNKVVLSIMSNIGLIKDLKRNGIEVVETNVGDKYVVEALKKYNLSVGGENSGHIILPEYFITGDGVLNALLVVKILNDTNTNINDWFNGVCMYSDKLVNIKVDNKEKVLNSTFLWDRVAEIKEELNNDCKIIIRASGTEDLIRVSVMAQSAELVEKYSNELVNIVKLC